MSERYEWVDARTAGVSIKPHGRRIGESRVDGEAAMVLGDPQGTALVVEGTRDELIDFGHRQVAAMKQMIVDLELGIGL